MGIQNGGTKKCTLDRRTVHHHGGQDRPLFQKDHRANPSKKIGSVTECILFYISELKLYLVVRMRYIDQMNIQGKRMLLRLDLNVPLDEDRNIEDDSRIKAILPTLRYSLDQGSTLFLVSHLDRPGGKVVPELSLAPVATRLTELLGEDVIMNKDVVGPTVVDALKDVEPGSVVLLENIRFHPGEEKNDVDLSRELASMADVFIDDAFADAHRSHASNVGVVPFVRESGGGLLMRREISALGQALDSPRRPLVAVIGGAKASSKMGVLENMSKKVDKLLLGGTMMLPFLYAQGLGVGSSKLDPTIVDVARHILGEDRIKGRLVLPLDLIVADRADDVGSAMTVDVDKIDKGCSVLDIGPRTRDLYRSELQKAGTIVWNGPMGMFEVPAFASGTRTIAEEVSRSTAFTLVGGGDTGSALRKFGREEQISYLSTGGGAFLEVLAGKELPAIKVLDDAERTYMASENARPVRSEWA